MQNFTNLNDKKDKVPYLLNMHVISSTRRNMTWEFNNEVQEILQMSLSQEVKKYINSQGKIEVDSVIKYSSYMIHEDSRFDLTGKKDKSEAECVMRETIIDCISSIMVNILPCMWKIYFVDSTRYAGVHDFDIPDDMMDEFGYKDEINQKTQKKEEILNFACPKEALRLKGMIDLQYELLKIKPPKTEVHCFYRSNDQMAKWANFPHDYTIKDLDPYNFIKSLYRV